MAIVVAAAAPRSRLRPITLDLLAASPTMLTVSQSRTPGFFYGIGKAATGCDIVSYMHERSLETAFGLRNSRVFFFACGTWNFPCRIKYNYSDSKQFHFQLKQDITERLLYLYNSCSSNQLFPFLYFYFNRQCRA